MTNNNDDQLAKHGRTLFGDNIALDISLVATFTALISVVSILPGIPLAGLAVPLTMQTLAVLLAAAVLGWLRGLISVLLYVVLGAVGLPIFTGGKAGLGVLVGPTGGYIFGFLVAAVITGYLSYSFALTSKKNRTPKMVISTVAGSLLGISVFGIIGLMLFAKMSLNDAFVTNLLYLPGDLIKAFLAAIVAVSLHLSLPWLRSKRNG